MGNNNAKIMRNPNDPLFQIKMGSKIQKEWIKFFIKQKKLLGQGNFGRVYLAQSRYDKTFYVVKEMMTQAQSTDVINLLKKEPETLEKLNKFEHPNLQYLVNWFRDEAESIIIVIEYREGKSLSKFIEEKKAVGQKIETKTIVNIFSQLLEILKFLWDNFKMVHRDLKPDNIYITKEETVILLDFGLARSITSSYIAETQAGTKEYQGPEYHDLDGTIKGCKGDIWSLGCVLFYLCTGKHAFQGKDEKDVKKKILSGFKGKIDSQYPEYLQQILEGLLKNNPKERKSYQEIAIYEEISKDFKNIAGLSKEILIKQRLVRIENRLKNLQIQIQSIENHEQETNQITEELKQSEVEENYNAEDSDESFSEEQEIDQFTDRLSIKSQVTKKELEHKLQTNIELKENLQKELKELNQNIMSEEKFNQVYSSLREHYQNAEIDKNCFFITKEDLKVGNLFKKDILKQAYKHQSKYNSFLFLVKTNSHPFGFFVPSKFEETQQKYTGKQLCFYQINDNQQLITCEKLQENFFSSDDDEFIQIELGINIQNDRYRDDYALLDSSKWTGSQQGIANYPEKDKNGNYFIGGRSSQYFKAQRIEIYGVNTKSDLIEQLKNQQLDIFKPEYNKNQEVKNIINQQKPFNWQIQEVTDDVKNRQIKPIQKLNDGSLYQGEWIKNKRDGRGINILTNGSTYYGFWKNNLKNGFGRYVKSNGEIYEGEFVDDQREGQGIITWPEGDRYVGSWKDGKCHGYGTLEWANGQKYVGQWEQGKKEGQGVFTWPSGDRYVGSWKDDERHGDGTQEDANGNKYVGQWEFDYMQGQGVFTWPSGDRYVGSWKDNEQHGDGTQEYADGSKYVGQWEFGNRHGKGLFIKDGESTEGIWEKGQKIE